MCRRKLIPEVSMPDEPVFLVDFPEWELADPEEVEILNLHDILDEPIGYDSDACVCYICCEWYCRSKNRMRKTTIGATIFRLHDARRSFACMTHGDLSPSRRIDDDAIRALIVCCKHTPSTYLRKRCIQIAYLNVWSEMVREWQPSMARTEAELIQRVEHSWEALRMKPDYFEKTRGRLRDEGRGSIEPLEFVRAPQRIFSRCTIAIGGDERL
ncbi:unnamed protein product [Trichogramma brassicae]|uniref:Uncharacterized protein n=1 Tax=Trichogramma brassicae TaxID=86971 RepID=A0A6H5J3V2_9HYME|nr:unnamed protein product [Trichogramma brassicae]